MKYNWKMEKNFEEIYLNVARYRQYVGYVKTTWQ